MKMILTSTVLTVRFPEREVWGVIMKVVMRTIMINTMMMIMTMMM